MKRFLCILLVTMIAILSGCSVSNVTKQEEIKNENNIFYTGQGEKWFATYSISKVNSSYFESLYIQYLVDRTTIEKNKEEQNIGPIEYKLVGNSMKLESSFPQKLKGIGNFHTATEMNAELFNTDYGDELILEIKWKDKTEKLYLKKLK
ncbi:hypothetical protein [Caloranaerobacter ferrireducens]|uniref:hypothetical protein n=1 Tax=Caloranaerobacter ferrireducens TaxID=1323370 RepID=UPI00084DCF7A|nr:hypothetical protein [Caloranaerobacter ferrireducens]